MKIMKSGIEMTPTELKKINGGACACGCNFSSMGLHATSENGGNCACNCKSGSFPFMDGGTTAANYL